MTVDHRRHLIICRLGGSSMRTHKLICTLLAAAVIAGSFPAITSSTSAQVRAMPVAMASEEEAYNEEGVTEFVTRLYDICIGRVPDSYGLADWTGQLKGGKATGVSVAYGFIFSEEFQSKGYSNDEYVEIMYNAFFGRSSDPAGKADWVGRMNGGMSREELFGGFANSREFFELCNNYGITAGCYITGSDHIRTAQINLFVERFYNIILGRPCDQNGMIDWSTRLANREISGADAAYGFIFSNEYRQKNRSDSDFLEDLYNAFMGRASDPDGKANWRRAFGAGCSDRDIFNGFTGSQEFMGICEAYGIDRGGDITTGESSARAGGITPATATPAVPGPSGATVTVTRTATPALSATATITVTPATRPTLTVRPTVSGAGQQTPSATPTSTAGQTDTPTPTRKPADTNTPTPTINPNFVRKKFDLGGNGTASGYIGVSSSVKYDAARGYGFADPAHAHNVQALGTGALSDAVSFDFGNAHFKVDLPVGVYKITVTTGNDYSTTISAEGINQLLFLTGNNATDSFTIPITDGQLNIYGSHGVGSQFSISTIEIEQVSEGTTTKPTIWLIGDSTVCNYYNVPDDDNARHGWGEFLPNYVDMDTYDIRNLSISGARAADAKRSAFPSFEAYGKPGDILLISVGINDYTDEYSRVRAAGLDISHIDPSNYIANVTEMVQRAKALGVTVYLVKQHGNYDDGSIYPLLDKKWFSEQLDQIAAAENVGIIDIFHPWLQFCLERTSRVARNYYQINEDGSVGIHPNARGADMLAGIVADQLFPSGGSGSSGPQITPPGPGAVIYHTAVAEETFTNPHKGYVMEVHSIAMLTPGAHPLGIDGSMNNHAWDVISTCNSVFKWEDLNPAEGVYNWTELDAMIDACDKAGYTYALRIMPYSTGHGSDANYGEEHDFVPQWVYDKGAKRDLATYKYGDQSVKILVPNWSDPIYNEAYMAFITALAERYDNDPRVEYIENRAYGNFGEWHTSEFNGNDMPSDDLQRAMIDHFASVFKHTTCSVYIDARSVYDYAVSRGCAMRNDGFILARNTEWELVPAYRANVMTMGDNHNTYNYMLNPSGTGYLSWTQERYRSSLETSHLTFFAIDQDSGCGYDIYREQQPLIDEMSKRLGYDLTVTNAFRQGNTLTITVKNIGLAPAFFDMDLCAEITDANGNKIANFGEPIRIDSGSFHDGEERTYVFEYSGTLSSGATICLSLYESGHTGDPTVRFDNTNTLPNNRLKLTVQ